MGNACASGEAVQVTSANTEESITEACVTEAPGPDELRVAEDSESSIEGNIVPSANVDLSSIESEYEEIKDILKPGSLYVDSIFKAAPQSLYYGNPPRYYDQAEWKRPSELNPNPQLLKGGVSSEDIIQGQLGNCWWLSAVVAVSREPRFINRIIPKGQVLKGDGYVGMVHFRFWRFGEWVDVVVDDMLPTFQNRLLMSKSSDPSEYWISLLEKAYAKLHGCYLSLQGGKPGDGMCDLTGGLSVVYKLKGATPTNFASIIHKSIKNGSFVCCNIDGKGGNHNLSNGLVTKHAYSVLGSEKIKNNGQSVHLVKVKNPWGGKYEWKGAYHDSAADWNTVSQADKNRLKLTDKDNGTWWMTLSDFTANFDDVNICSIGPDFDEDGDPSGDSWLTTQINGEWVPGESAGGSRNNLVKYASNPQYLIEIKEADNFDPAVDEPSDKGKATVIIGLMQENRRAGRADGLKDLFINAKLFKVPGAREDKLNAVGVRGQVVGDSGSYINSREVTLTADLVPGFYVLIPSTYHLNKEGTFLARIYAEKKIVVTEL